MQIRALIGNKRAGQKLDRAIAIDGVLYSSRYEVSRVLTDTIAEHHQGLFSKKDIIKRPGGVELHTEFNTELNLDNYINAQDFVDEVKRRADLINAAFAKKYPAYESVGVAKVILSVPVTTPTTVIDGTFR